MPRPRTRRGTDPIRDVSGAEPLVMAAAIRPLCRFVAVVHLMLQPLRRSHP